jgi:hypothetical protein
VEFLADHAARRPEKTALRVSGGTSEPGRFEEWSFSRLNAAVLALSAR